MSPITGEYIINSPRKPPRKLILLKSVQGVILMVKNGVIKKKVENDSEHIIIPIFWSEYILPISPKMKDWFGCFLSWDGVRGLNIIVDVPRIPTNERASKMQLRPRRRLEELSPPPSLHLGGLSLAASPESSDYVLRCPIRAVAGTGDIPPKRRRRHLRPVVFFFWVFTFFASVPLHFF
jgi:hypothetical protein